MVRLVPRASKDFFSIRQISLQFGLKLRELLFDMRKEQFAEPGTQRPDADSIFRQALEVGSFKIRLLRDIALSEGIAALLEFAILEAVPT